MIVGQEHTPPEVWARCAEKRELLRMAAASALKRGADLDPTTRLWAQHWAGQPALAVPLSTGEPTP
jgi:hypothetical protein